MLVIGGLETTNMAFITLIQALCQQSFGLSLPQNCVRSLTYHKIAAPAPYCPLHACLLFVWRLGSDGG
jgi:hypothetical protein